MQGFFSRQILDLTLIYASPWNAGESGLNPWRSLYKFGCCRTGIKGSLARASPRAMTIVADPTTSKSQNPRLPSPPLSQPPPSYAESAATQAIVAQPGSSSVVPTTHGGYGPTPISQQQQAILPYYDPRSVYSVQVARRRARERFIGAVAWTVLILALLPVLVWVDIRIQLGWSASYFTLLCCGLKLTNLLLFRPPHTSQRRDLVLLVVSPCICFDKKHAMYLFDGRCSVHNMLGYKNGLFRHNHRERVVVHTDGRVEFSRHTLLSLPALPAPNDNSDHDHTPLPMCFVHPPVLWMYLHWLPRLPIFTG